MFLCVLTLTTAASAQEMTQLGTVVTVEAARIQVRLVDNAGKPGETRWFAVEKDTRVKRGDQLMAYSDAKIAKGERIAVLTNMSTRNPMSASELRLAPIGQAATATPDPHAGHQMTGQQPMDMPVPSSGWSLMQDGVVYGLFNQQGGPRGGDEFVVPNWWMGVWTRDRGPNQFGLNAMFSLDAATVGKSGYREIFQVGEALDGKPLIDHQHPHDLFMQLAASWRRSIGSSTYLTIAGGPSGEPTLGPVAFIHRASAAGLVLAPLGHHTFDSTHVSFGVVTAAVERGRFTFEASVFNGREPDEERWDFDFGALDSVAGRVWFRPSGAWEVQVSSGKLREPEELVEGDVVRTTTSVSYFRADARGFKAFTGGYGVNAAHGEHRHGVFGEFTVERGANSMFGRVEWQQTETDVLVTGDLAAVASAEAGAHEDHSEDASPVTAFTIGGARNLASWRGFDGAIGGQVVFYRVPAALTQTHGEHPVSFQVFFRLRLPSTGTARMWNMRMSQGHRMDMGDHR